VSDLLTALQLSNKTVIYKELKLRQYKTILKCLINDSIDAHNFLLNLNNILKTITNLSEEEILNLNFLEYLLLLTEIRVTSLGSSIFAVYKQGNDSMNIEIPLYTTIESIKKCIDNFKPLQVVEDNTTLSFVLPKIKDVFEQKKFLCISEDVSNLPARHLKSIKKNIRYTEQQVEKFNFFDASIKKYNIKLSINLQNFIQLIKILFNENLISVYDNIFYLSKICNISSEYLENCTYGEFKIFVKKTEELFQKTVNPSTKTDEQFFEPVDINSLYGNDDSLQVSRSEFTP
jgi:hypothetical protein